MGKNGRKIQKEKKQPKYTRADLKLIAELGIDGFLEMKAKEAEETEIKLQETEERVLKELGYDKPKQEAIPETTEAPLSEPVQQVQVDEPKGPVIVSQTDSSLLVEPLVKTVDKPEASELVIEITAPAESIKVEAPIIVPIAVTEKTETKETGGNMEPVVDKRFKGFSKTLEKLVCQSGACGSVNAAHTDDNNGISMSTHYPLYIKDYGKIIPVVILPDEAGLIYGMKKLPAKDVGKWTRDNIEDWEAGIYYGKLKHCNIISTERVNLHKPIKGLALISAKEVTQTMKEKQIFHHIIIVPDESITPAFELTIDNSPERDMDEVAFGPTVGALFDNKEVKEYLHLKSCKH